METFIKLVHDMRVAQREYFSSRSGAALLKAKGLERAVDAEILKFSNKNQNQ